MSLVPSLVDFIAEKLTPGDRKKKQVKNIGVEVEFASENYSVSDVEYYLDREGLNEFGGKPLEITSRDGYFSGTEGKARIVLVKRDHSADLEGEDSGEIPDHVIEDVELEIERMYIRWVEDLKDDLKREKIDEFEEEWQNEEGIFDEKFEEWLDATLEKSEIESLENGERVKIASINYELDDMDDAKLWFKRNEEPDWSDEIDDSWVKDNYDIDDHWDSFKEYVKPQFRFEYGTTADDVMANWDSIGYAFTYLDVDYMDIEYETEGGGIGIEIVTPRIAASDSNIESIVEMMRNAMEFADGVTHDDAGIHVHFGLNGMFETAHMLRLIIEVGTRHDELGDIAGRSITTWAKSMESEFRTLQEGAQDAVNTNSIAPFIAAAKRAASVLKGDRYKVANFTNVDSRGTIEFRLGSSYLLDHASHFEQWIESLRDLVNASLSDDWIYVPGVTLQAVQENFATHKAADEGTVRFRLDGRQGVLQMQIKQSNEWKQHGEKSTSDALQAMKQPTKSKPLYPKESTEVVLPRLSDLAAVTNKLDARLSQEQQDKIVNAIEHQITPSLNTAADVYHEFAVKAREILAESHEAGDNLADIREKADNELNSLIQKNGIDIKSYDPFLDGKKQERIIAGAMSASKKLRDVVDSITDLPNVSNIMYFPTDPKHLVQGLVKVVNINYYEENINEYAKIVFTYAMSLELDKNMSDNRREQMFEIMFPGIGKTYGEVLANAEDVAGVDLIGLEGSKITGKEFADKRKEYRQEIANMFGQDDSIDDDEIAQRNLQRSKNRREYRHASKENAKARMKNWKRDSAQNRVSQLRNTYQNNQQEVAASFADNPNYETFKRYIDGDKQADPRPFLRQASQKLPHIFGRQGAPAMESLLESIGKDLQSSGVGDAVTALFGA